MFLEAGDFDVFHLAIELDNEGSEVEGCHLSFSTHYQLTENMVDEPKLGLSDTKMMLKYMVSKTFTKWLIEMGII